MRSAAASVCTPGRERSANCEGPGVVSPGVVVSRLLVGFKGGRDPVVTRVGKKYLVVTSLEFLYQKVFIRSVVVSTLFF